MIENLNENFFLTHSYTQHKETRLQKSINRFGLMEQAWLFYFTSSSIFSNQISVVRIWGENCPTFFSPQTKLIRCEAEQRKAREAIEDIILYDYANQLEERKKNGTKLKQSINFESEHRDKHREQFNGHLV